MFKGVLWVPLQFENNVSSTSLFFHYYSFHSLPLSVCLFAMLVFSAHVCSGQTGSDPVTNSLLVPATSQLPILVNRQGLNLQSIVHWPTCWSLGSLPVSRRWSSTLAASHLVSPRSLASLQLCSWTNLWAPFLQLVARSTPPSMEPRLWNAGPGSGSSDRMPHRQHLSPASFHPARSRLFLLFPLEFKELLNCPGLHHEGLHRKLWSNSSLGLPAAAFTSRQIHLACAAKHKLA